MEFIIDNIWWIGLVILSGGGLVWMSMEGRGTNVSSLQATQLINQDKAVIVDVRPANEFAQGHMPGALNFPLSELPLKVGQLNKYQSKTVVLVCASGTQSRRARAQLKKIGFNEVYVLNGGFADWQSQGLPTTK
jgi:rhodanese-related sulfurtransferase